MLCLLLRSWQRFVGNIEEDSPNVFNIGQIVVAFIDCLSDMDFIKVVSKSMFCGTSFSAQSSGSHLTLLFGYIPCKGSYFSKSSLSTGPRYPDLSIASNTRSMSAQPRTIIVKSHFMNSSVE